MFGLVWVRVEVQFGFSFGFGSGAFGRVFSGSVWFVGSVRFSLVFVSRCFVLCRFESFCVVSRCFAVFRVVLHRFV